MDKTIKRIIIFYAIIILLFGIYMISMKLAFGPIHKKFNLQISENVELFCEETYNGDFAGEFYDVDFFIENIEDKEFIGQVTFYHDDWEEDFTAKKTIGNWDIVVLEINESNRIFAFNIDNKKMFELIEDRLEENEEWIASSEIKCSSSILYRQISLDTIIEDCFYVNYDYRLGFNEPFEYYSQIIEYEFSQKTGKLVYEKANLKQEISE